MVTRRLVSSSNISGILGGVGLAIGANESVLSLIDEDNILAVSGWYEMSALPYGGAVSGDVLQVELATVVVLLLVQYGRLLQKFGVSNAIWCAEGRRHAYS